MKQTKKGVTTTYNKNVLHQTGSSELFHSIKSNRKQLHANTVNTKPFDFSQPFTNNTNNRNHHLILLCCLFSNKKAWDGGALIHTHTADWYLKHL